MWRFSKDRRSTPFSSRRVATWVLGDSIYIQDITCDPPRANHEAELNRHFPPPSRTSNQNAFAAKSNSNFCPRLPSISSGFCKWIVLSCWLRKRSLRTRSLSDPFFKVWNLLNFLHIGPHYILVTPARHQSKPDYCQDGVWGNWTNTCLWCFCVYKSRWSFFSRGWCRQYNLPWFSFPSTSVSSLNFGFNFQKFELSWSVYIGQFYNTLSIYTLSLKLNVVASYVQGYRSTETTHCQTKSRFVFS